MYFLWYQQSQTSVSHADYILLYFMDFLILASVFNHLSARRTMVKDLNCFRFFDFRFHFHFRFFVSVIFVL